jgi:hypothetical protein
MSCDARPRMVGGQCYGFEEHPQQMYTNLAVRELHLAGGQSGITRLLLTGHTDELNRQRDDAGGAGRGGADTRALG